MQDKQKAEPVSVATWIAVIIFAVIIAGIMTQCGGDKSKDATDAGLTSSSAIDACRAYGENQFPQGFDISTIATNTTVEKDHVLVNMEDVKVGTAFGTTIHQDFGCAVKGSESEPEVVWFEKS